MVTIQFLLFVIYLYNPFKKTIYQGNHLNFTALIVFFIGLLVMLFSILALRKSISPFPSPKKNADLIQHGIYHYVRHPIYTSILLVTFGWAIYTNSLFRIFIFILFIFLFEIKSNYEEKLLINKFYDYQNYKKITGKYFPKIN
jgi:protein-S-isoprenylcysteine O-methyltransferase Ste14